MHIVEIVNIVISQKPNFRFFVFFCGFSVFVGFLDTDVGFDFGFVKYCDIRFRFRLPTRLYYMVRFVKFVVPDHILIIDDYRVTPRKVMWYC